MTARVRTHTHLPAPLSMRSRLRLSCGFAALAAAAAMASPEQAKAQAFQGNETVVAGSASRTITSTTSETITVGSPTATINWSPYDAQGAGTVNFLPSGHTATFTNNPNTTADFTVLNRIIPLDTSRPISLNGHVISQLQDLSGNVTRGGNVWFHSPGGIMVGATAVFDVGGLLLTVNDPVSWSTTSTGFTGQFVTDPTSNAQVNIASGAQINALANNSYVALVAPRVEQHGSIRVDGTAALVAAQDVSLTMNQGLFDIVVNVGTDDANGVVHTGSTGGPSSSGAGDNHRVYMVAVPKNQALTMLLSGNVGFEPATVAGVENGDIVLGSGWETTFQSNTEVAYRNASPLQSNVTFGPGNYSSDVSLVATGDVFAIADTGSLTFAGKVGLSSSSGTISGRVHVGATNGHSITVGEYLWLDSRPDAPVAEVLLYAQNGGSVSVGGFANLYSFDQNGNGGLATMFADNGSISISGVTHVAAAGFFSGADSTTPMSATGGTVDVWAANAGTITTGDLTLSAFATGQRAFLGGVAGSGTAGSISMNAGSGGEISVNGNLTGNADGTGGDVYDDSTGGGNGTGGTVYLTANSGAVTVAGATTLTANGTGGSSAAGATGTQSGGDGTGGSVEVHSGAGGEISVSNLAAQANGTGGNATSGGDGIGGAARLGAVGGDVSVGGTMTLAAGGGGGAASNGSGGNGTGGIAHAYAQDATLSFASATVSTNGSGGNGTVGGRGMGGIAPASDTAAPTGGSFLSVRNGSILGTNLTVNSTGTGGAGSSGSGGHGVGGLASVTALNGTTTGLIDVDNVTVNASASGGAGGAGSNGGIGQGGEAHLTARAVNGALAVDAATIRATGTGGAGGTGLSGGAGGVGGAGYGGFTNFGTASGEMTSTDRAGIATFGTVDADVSGIGGSGGSGETSGAGGTGGVGIGGTATLLARGSRVNATAVGITANGTGGLGGLDGSGATRAAAGIGIGGDAGLLATNIFQGTDPSTVVVGSLTASASGIAADASAATQAGGVLIEVVNSSAQLGTVNMTAAGAGPRNFTGTDAFGNSFTLTPLQSGLIAGSTIHITGNGQITSGDSITVQANPGGLVDVDGNLTLTSGGDISILTVDSGRIAVGGTLGATTLASASGRGRIYMATTSSTNQPPTQPGIQAGALSLTSALDVDLQGVVADGAANIVYAGDAELGHLSADTVQLRLAAVPAPNEDHILAITGLVSARTISLESGDLVFEPNGQLGEPGLTSSLELIARSMGQPIVIGDGGPVGAGQYHLSQADAQQIEAASVTFRATSGTADLPQVLVRNLTIQGSAGGGTSSVELITPGSVRVEGDLAYIDAAATDALTITANERLEVITPDGSIRMVAPDGGLAGILTLQSPNIVVTDAALAAQLADDPNFAGRDDALATNSGPVNEAGYLEAGGIQLLTSGNIFIQNSGTATEFAGLTVGGQGLLVGRYQASSNPDGTQSFSFVGTLTTADGVLLFDFTITSETEITLRTYSYAGGVNGAGETIPSGGFDPILALFDAAGVLINQNDDGGANVPADPTTGSRYDTFLQAMLPAGTYTVSITAYSNFAQGPNLSDGFDGGGSFGNRTPNFAFDVIGADLATGPGATGPITVIAFGRMQNADGSFTGGADFFNAADFSIDSGVEYTQGSTFNSFAIGQPIPGPTPEPPPPGPQPGPQPAPQPAPPPGTNPQTVLGPVELIVSETGTDPEDDPDASGTGVSTSTSLVSTGPGVLEGLLDEAVTSGGDTAQWIDVDQDDDPCVPGDQRQQCQERTN